jgi:hypothetical protein
MAGECVARAAIDRLRHPSYTVPFLIGNPAVPCCRPAPVGLDYCSLCLNPICTARRLPHHPVSFFGLQSEEHQLCKDVGNAGHAVVDAVFVAAPTPMAHGAIRPLDGQTSEV